MGLKLPTNLLGLIVGRILIVGCSFFSVRIATGLLGPYQIGVANLVLNIAALFTMVIGSIGAFFLRHILDWIAEHRLLRNIHRYALFLLLSAAVACCGVLILNRLNISEWKANYPEWLPVYLAANIFFVTLNNTFLYILNVSGRSFAYVLLSNLSAWGGVSIAAAACLFLRPGAEFWLVGLLLGHVISFGIGLHLLLSRHKRNEQHAVLVSSADFNFRVVARFSWPLLLCTGFYWVQRNSFAPIMAAANGIVIVGLFSVAFSVGLAPLAAFDTLFKDYYSPIYYCEIVNSDSEKKTYAWNRYMEVFIPAVLINFIFVSALGNGLLRILVNSEFHGLGGVVAWGALSQTIISVYSMYVLLANTFMDNRVLLIPNLVGAIVAAALLLVLLPEYQMNGAGLAINLGLFATTLLAAKRFIGTHKIGFPFWRGAKAIIYSSPMLLLSFIDKKAWAQLPTVYVGIIIILAGIFVLFVQYYLVWNWMQKATV